MYQRNAGGAALRASAGEAQAFRLIAIRPEVAPEGCVGRDWFVYEIVQGENMITGHRRGEIDAVTADVERIVLGLNERLMKTKGKPGPKPGTAGAKGRAKPPPPANEEDRE
jgi:hypothetical protein